MPQIGWLEIISIVVIDILVLGPKEFPIALNRIGSSIGKIKNYFSKVQRDITEATSEVEVKDSKEKTTNKNNKND